jgi:hypothetical protein
MLPPCCSSLRCSRLLSRLATGILLSYLTRRSLSVLSALAYATIRIGLRLPPAAHSIERRNLLGELFGG